MCRSRLRVEVRASRQEEEGRWIGTLTWAIVDRFVPVPERSSNPLHPLLTTPPKRTAAPCTSLHFCTGERRLCARRPHTTLPLTFTFTHTTHASANLAPRSLLLSLCQSCVCFLSAAVTNISSHGGPAAAIFIIANTTPESRSDPTPWKW